MDWGGGGVLPIMACTGRFRLKGYLQVFRLQVYKREGIAQVEVYKREENGSYRYLKGPLIFQIHAPYGCISLFIKYYMKMRTRLPKVGMRKGYLFAIKGI